MQSNAHVTYILKSLNIKLSEYRQQLSQQRDDGTRNRDEIITMCPEGMNRDQWASFVDYRLNSRTKVITTIFSILLSVTLLIFSNFLHICLGNFQKK